MNSRNIVLKAQINSHRKIEIPLSGRCMEPMLLAGDTVAVKPYGDLLEGQFYLFELPTGELAMHRLIDKSDGMALMKGDRSKKSELVPYNNILGIAFKVKLKGCEFWKPVKHIRKKHTFIALCSRLHKWDKENEQINLYKGIIKKAVSVILITYGRCIRCYWRLWISGRNKIIRP